MNINYTKSLFYHSKNDQKSFENKLGLADQNFTLKFKIEWKP